MVTTRIVNFEGGTTYDFVVATKLHTSTSHRPLWDLAMGTEAARVGQMLYALKQTRATIYELKTDAVLYRPLKRRKVNVLQDITRGDLHNMRDRFEGGGLGRRS